MIALDVALLVLALFTTLNYFVHRSVLYPPFILCSMWLLDLVIYRSGLIEINAIHANTLEIVIGGIAMFSLGGLLASLLPSALFRIHVLPFAKPQGTNFLRNALTVILIASLPFFLENVLRAAASGTGTTLLMRARSTQIAAVESGDVHWSILGLIQIITLYVPLLFALDRRDWRFWSTTLVAIVVAILSTGRTDLLLLISGLSAVYLLRTGRETFKNAVRFLRGPLVVFMFLYVGLIFTNKNTDELGISGGVFGIATYFILSYIVGPLAAFDGVVQSTQEYAISSSHIFEFPLKLATSLHLMQYDPPYLANTFVTVPFPTNVYTMFKFYFLELGVGGTMAALLLFGTLHSALYRKAKFGSRFGTYLFGYALYSIVLSIFDDGYYLIGGLLRAATFGLFFLYLSQLDFRLLPAGALRASRQFARAEGSMSKKQAASLETVHRLTSSASV